MIGLLPKLQTPEQWEKELKVKIIDPDGWRNEHVAWDLPISRERFNELALGSTIKNFEI